MRRKQLVFVMSAALVLPVPVTALSGQSHQASQTMPDSEAGNATPGLSQFPGAASSSSGGMQEGVPATGDTVSAGNAPGTDQVVVNPDVYLYKEVINTRGDKVGEVDTLVTSRTGTVEAVINIDGFQGAEARKIVVPVEQLQPRDGRLVVNSAVAEDELKRATPFDPSEFSAFEAEPQEHPSPDETGHQ